MNKLIISTVGISIANSCEAQKDLVTRKTTWDDDVKQLEKEIADFVSETTDIRKISAEMNTLDRIGVSKADRMVFLSTDDAMGRVCSEALKKVLMDEYGLGSSQIELKRIEGLQVRDAKKLREQGLKNFVKVVLDYLNDPQFQYSYETIINPTGGFKGVLPFLTTLGMLYGRRTVYIFEFADELIDLPPLPFSFDLQMYRRVRPALSYIDKETAVPEDAYLGKILDYTPSERDLFMAFTEPCEEGLITLSPLAFCLLEIESDQESVMVSKKISDSLEKMDPNPRTSLKRLINNAGNPLWRNIHAHRWENNDLLIMKQGRTAERIAGFIKNNKFHVTHAFADHDDYERTLGKCSKKDFAETEFIRWEDPGDPDISEDDRDALVDERDHLLREKQALQTSLDKGKKRRKKLEKKAAALSAEIENYLQEIEEQKAGAENLNATISRVNEENSRLKDRVESLDATISQKVEDNSRLKGRLDSLDSRVGNIENKICRLQEKPSNTPNERRFSLEGYLKKLIMGKA